MLSKATAVCFFYGSAVPLAVNNVNVQIDEFSFTYDFSVEDGEALAILGSSGSGKTTLLNAIAGLQKVESGSIVLNGKEITSLPPYERSIAYVFQDYALFESMSVKDNIAFPMKIRHYKKAEIDRKVKELLEVVELSGFERHNAGTLSGGEKQRVAIARALSSEPSLLLLDEPLSALDLNLRSKMRTFLKNIKTEYSLMTILVTHDKEDAAVIADRTISLLKK